MADHGTEPVRPPIGMGRRTGTPEPDQTLFTWFRTTAAAHPFAAAIDVRHTVLSYRELLEVAERLATRLAEAAAGPPRRVALLASRGLAAHAAYLAALRLGATVVPLNPAAPPARNRTICRSARVDLIVVEDGDDAGARELLADVGRGVVMLGGQPPGHRPRRPAPDPWEWIDSLPDQPWRDAYRGTPDDVAYVVFTSGSTGTPKGVPIRHRNVTPCIAYSADRYAVGPGSRVSHAFDLAFDPSVIDTFMAWRGGATLVVLQPDDVLAPSRSVTARGITHWNSVPSVISIAHRLRALPADSMPGLRWAVFGGEQFTVELAQAWAAAAPGCAIDNVYGPTELSINCALYRLPSDRRRWPRTTNGTLPVGRIHPHLDAVVLDDDGWPADEGELCVRGVQRFDGYLDPDRNPGRFLHYAGDRATVLQARTPPADAWYRTGDRVRREPSGELVHLGRIDTQVKIGGYRIELGEIESVLREFPAVREAVVTAVPRGGGPWLTAAYTGEVADPGDLVAFARSRLPDFMVPRQCHRFAEFPRLANGKTDRGRLAARLAELVTRIPVARAVDVSHDPPPAVATTTAP